MTMLQLAFQPPRKNHEKPESGSVSDLPSLRMAIHLSDLDVCAWRVQRNQGMRARDIPMFWREFDQPPHGCPYHPKSS